MPSSIRDYFELADDTRRMDFVHSIDVGTENAAAKLKTLRDYEVTPSVSKKLESALARIGEGLKNRQSAFTWIHGSFGSGKSHFMHVLSLLLADDQLVYSEHPELQAHRAKFHPAAIGKKLFRLHVKCISREAQTLEEIVFGPATEEIARLHPENPAPALYETTKVFAAAREFLNDLGDEKFFAGFPSNEANDDAAEWGSIGSKWDRTRFEKAAANPDSADGRALAGELARTRWLKDIVTQAKFVGLSKGLQILASHMKGLGYEGIVLFLDELVLWLSMFQDKQRLSEEATKVAALIEYEHEPALPYFTFAARQRDLSQMVGAFAIGRDEEIFKDRLKFWESRFETIEIEHRDLARIIEKRLLRVKGERKGEIDAAFAEFKTRYQKDFQQLFGDQGDAEDFRRVYPFSPALVETTIALSGTLDRSRTALRELTSLLVKYLPDFELGSVVPVGDLFDVIVHGKISDLSAIQQVYEQVRRVYEDDLLPYIRQKNQTDSKERCQLMRDDFDKQLGCSGCAEKTCRTQTRIAKTVLLQGLAPNAPALKNLTATRIVALNSGTLKSKVPNQEATIAAGYLRDWASRTTAIQVQGDANPLVRAALDSIDSRRILDANRGLDNVQRRRKRVRDMIFRKLQVDLQSAPSSRTFEWCSRKWNIGVVYDNVRAAPEAVFRCGDDEDLRLVVDFPFDDVGHSPREDETKVRAITEKGRQDTVAWLPSFLNEDVQNQLGDLVILDGLVELRNEDFGQKVPWVSADDLGRAREALSQQRALKETQVENALLSAYGVTNTFDEKLAPGQRPERHVYLLVQDAPITLPPEGDLDRALEGILRQAFQRIAPRHPPFTEQPTRARLEAVLESLTEVVQSDGQKKKITDAKRLRDIKGIASVEHMNIVRVVEDEVIFANGGIIGEVQRRLQAQTGALSVDAVRSAIDPDGLMRLRNEIEDFVIVTYALTSPTPYRFKLHGNPVEPVLGKLHKDMELVPVTLPTMQQWDRALTHAGVFGKSLGGRALSASRLDDLAALVGTHAQKLVEEGLGELSQLVQQWAQLLGIPDVAATQRGEIVMALADLTSNLPKPPFETIVLLAELTWKSARFPALTAMAHPPAIAALRAALKQENHRSLVERGIELEAQGNADAKAALDALRQTLRNDENVDGLAKALALATNRIVKLLAPAQKQSTPPLGPPSPPEPGIEVETRKVDTADGVRTLARDLDAVVEGGGSVDVELRISRRGRR